MAAPLNTCTTIEQHGVVCFLWVKIWKQRTSTKKCCPCRVNIAYHVKQSSKTRSFGGTLSWRWCGWKSSVRVVLTATKRILRHRFPGASETVGQVFKFVWRFVRVVLTATKRILRHRFPGASETVGQVFKFVWRLCWNINVVCMSLSPFNSFQSQFVTYLLNRPRIICLNEKAKIAQGE